MKKQDVIIEMILTEYIYQRDKMTQQTDEKDFLAHYDSQQFEQLSVTTDLLIFSISDVKTDNYRKLPEKMMSVYLIKRSQFPCKDKWSLAGGFVHPNETLEETAKKVLKQKINLDNLYLEQLYTFDKIDRDPRTRILSVGYMALVNRKELPSGIQQSNNWFNIQQTDSGLILKNEQQPDMIFDLSHENCLAFDHAHIIQVGLNRLKNKIEYTDLAFHLVPHEFTLTELQNVYEAILGKKLLAPAFRRVIKSRVQPTGHTTTGSGHRPSALFYYAGDKSII